ncbi:MAG: HU family DNA-binding protein [Acidothermus sp.]|nr:HU family DNA-binding protein [Acidothermus sp.]
MNKAELISSVAARLGDKRTASEAVEAVIDTITRTVARGEKVAITGFGIFEKVERAARMARNPATGERVRVKKTSVPKFRPGTHLKGVVSGAIKLPAVKATASAPAKATRSTATKAATKSTGRRTAAKTTARASARTARKVTTTRRVAAKKTTARKTAGRRGR